MNLSKNILRSELGDLPALGWHRLAKQAELKLEGLYHQEQGLPNLEELDEKINSFLARVNTKTELEQVIGFANQLMVGKEISALENLKRRLRENSP